MHTVCILYPKRKALTMDLLGMSRILARMRRNEHENGLVGEGPCLEFVFPNPESRPCSDTWRAWRDAGLFPFLKINRRYFYNPTAVRKALERRFMIGEESEATSSTCSSSGGVVEMHHVPDAADETHDQKRVHQLADTRTEDSAVSNDGDLFHEFEDPTL